MSLSTACNGRSTRCKQGSLWPWKRSAPTLTTRTRLPVNLRTGDRALPGGRVHFHDEWPTATGTITAVDTLLHDVYVRWDDGAPKSFNDGWYAASSLDLTTTKPTTKGTHVTRKPLLAILALIMALPLLAACGEFANTEAAEVGCVFNGGWLDSKDFREYTPPGAGRDQVGWGSEVVEVPLRLVTYEVSLDPERGDTAAADSIKVNVGGMAMQFEPTVRMTFNTAQLEGDDGDPIEGTAGGGKPAVCELVEVQLKPFDATDFNTPGGQWQYFWLANRFRPWLDVAGVRALQDAADPVALYFNLSDDGEEADGRNVGARDAAAEVLGQELTKELNAALGGQYFCGPDHTWLSDNCSDLQVTLPQPVVSNEDEQILNAPRRARTSANARVSAAEQETRAQVAEAEEAATRATEVAVAREREATAAVRKADADELIATQEARTKRVNVENDYIWCEVVRSYGEPCWLVKAAENGSLPDVLGEIPSDVQVTVPVTGGGQ